MRLLESVRWPLHATRSDDRVRKAAADERFFSSPFPAQNPPKQVEKKSREANPVCAQGCNQDEVLNLCSSCSLHEVVGGHVVDTVGARYIQDVLLAGADGAHHNRRVANGRHDV